MALNGVLALISNASTLMDTKSCLYTVYKTVKWINNL